MGWVKYARAGARDTTRNGGTICVYSPRRLAPYRRGEVGGGGDAARVRARHHEERKGHAHQVVGVQVDIRNQKFERYVLSRILKLIAFSTGGVKLNDVTNYMHRLTMFMSLAAWTPRCARHAS